MQKVDAVDLILNVETLVRLCLVFVCSLFLPLLSFLTVILHVYLLNIKLN